jgi:hypothetical protein
MAQAGSTVARRDEQMAIKWQTVKAGDVLYDARRTKMGNTTMSTLSVWEVRIIEIDHAAGAALVSWNGNPPKRYSSREVVRLRRSKPKTRETRSGARVPVGREPSR